MADSDPLGKEIELVVFDFDGTLVDLGIDWDIVRGDMRSYLNSAYGRDFDFSSLEGGWRSARSQLGDDICEPLTEILRRHEYGAVDDARPLPGLDTARLVSGIKRVAILSSNLTDTVEAVLSRNGAGFFEHVFGRDRVEVVKPHPSGLLYLIDAAGVSIGSTVMVGDRDVDEEAAIRAGVGYYDIDDFNLLFEDGQYLWT